MSIFGWDLPPGCSGRDIDNAFGAEPVCDLCGVGVDACDCPDCLKCGEVGRAECLTDHDMTLTPEQIAIGWAQVVKQAALECTYQPYEVEQ